MLLAKKQNADTNNENDVEAEAEKEKEHEKEKEEVVTASSTEPDCPKFVQEADSQQMLTVVLGTGSAEPSKHRCSSSIYLKLNTGGMLLDVGEDCKAQLERHFGDHSSRVIGELWCVWVSHKHADHLLGLLGIAVFQSHNVVVTIDL